VKASTQPCLLRAAAQAFGDATALLSRDARVSFRTLDRRVSKRARALAAETSPGTWVALNAAPTAAGLVELLALLRAGLRVLPVNPALPGEPLRALMARYPILRLLEPPAGPLPEGGGPGVFPEAPETLEFAADSPCTGILTSGSTRLPKVAVHSYRNHVLSAEGAARTMGLAAGDRYLLSLPWFHVSGLAIVFRCLLQGATVVLGGRPDDSAFLRRMRISHVSMVETQLRRLVVRPQRLPDLRCVLLGGGAVRPEILEAARAAGIRAWLSYGLTEMGSLVISQDPEGRASLLPHRECRIARDGEILVRGETLFLGYLEPGGGLNPATDADGWFHTRDLGRWEGDAFRVIGRLDNQFVSGGENVQPENIEAVLYRHPAIEQAVVVPRADAEFGQRPVAFLDTVGEIDHDALRNWLRQHLNPWELPVAFHPLPRSDGIKVRRADLIELAACDPA
jgi:o-succinylbenzoate---CoA ligase